MVDERRPTKKVVKKVVKKTVVVRPAQPGSTGLRTASPPRVDTPLSKPATDAAPTKTKTRRRPTIRIPTPPRRPGAGLAGRARAAGSRVGDRARDATFRVNRTVRRGATRVRNARLPALAPLPASAVTGFVVGLLAVILGWLSYVLLSAAGSTTAGGGWGALILVVVAFLTFVAGELLLEGFGIEHGRVISATSIMLVLVVVLMFFLDLAAGVGAWVLLPLLGALAFMGSWRLISMASDQPNPR